MPTGIATPPDVHDRRLALCGDVMLGRGVDQLFRHPSSPRLEEPFIHDARDYLALVERYSGPIIRPVDPAYVWGDALPELDRPAVHARIINLETSVTRSELRWPGKEIHYRMHPDNVDVLTRAGIDVCVLANNHVLDHGYPGLEETLVTLERAGLRTAGAGQDVDAARAPAVVPHPSGRVLVFGVASPSSGVPREWAAGANRPGVAMVSEWSEPAARELAARAAELRQRDDIVVVSIHWGSNWGYEVTDAQVAFAHALIDGGVDVVHGHSSHHPRPFEVYRDRLVLYGCGDFLNDYEGISGYEAYRSELTLLYLPTLAPDGALRSMSLVPFRIRRMRLERASRSEAGWLASTLTRHGRRFGTRLEVDPDGRLSLG